MMRALPKIVPLSLLVLATAACSPRGNPDDPAYGGFFRGIENISDGTYDARIASREQKVAALQAREQRLLAERNSVQRRISTQQNALAHLKHDIVVARVRLGDENLDAGTRAQIKQALASQPSGNTNQARLAALQKTIADTRELAQRLTKLAG